jgi:GGDEF domain-containing protein
MAVALHKEPEKTLVSSEIGRIAEMLASEVIRVEAAEAEEHQSRLRKLATRATPDLEQLLQLELHAYRESAEKKVEQLRRDLASTADAMQEYIARFSSQDQNQETLFRTDLERLSKLRRLSDVSQIHAGLAVVQQSIAGTVEQIKAQNQAIIAQLRDEIRTLHKRLDNPDRRDPRGGTLVNRAPFERRIRLKVNNQEIFSLYLIRVTNWKEIVAILDQEHAQTLVTNIADRLAQLLGPDTFTGRWYDGYFAAILGVDKRKAMEGASDLAQQLAGAYSTGRSPVAIRVRVAVVDYIPGQDADQTLLRVEQLIRAFEG